MGSNGHNGNGNGNGSTGSIPKGGHGTLRQRIFAEARLQGLSQPAAAKKAGYKGKTVPSNVERRCIDNGLLPDPHKEAERLRSTVEHINRTRDRARKVIVDALDAETDQIAAALLKAAKRGNVAAINLALDRLLGPVRLEVSGPDTTRARDMLDSIKDGLSDEARERIEQAAGLLN